MCDLEIPSSASALPLTQQPADGIRRLSPIIFGDSVISSFQNCNPLIQSCSENTFQVPSVVKYAYVGLAVVAGSFLVRSGNGIFAVGHNMPLVERAIEEGRIEDATQLLRTVAVSLHDSDVTVPVDKNEASFWADTLEMISGRNPKNLDQVFEYAEAAYRESGDNRALSSVLLAKARRFGSMKDTLPEFTVGLYQSAIDAGGLLPDEVTNARAETGIIVFNSKKYENPIDLVARLGNDIPFKHRIGEVGEAIRDFRLSVAGGRSQSVMASALYLGDTLLTLQVAPELAEAVYAQVVNSPASLDSFPNRGRAVLGMAEAASMQNHSADALSYASWARVLLSLGSEQLLIQRCDGIINRVLDESGAKSLIYRAHEELSANRPDVAMPLFAQAVTIRAGDNPYRAGIEWEEIGDELIRRDLMAFAMIAYRRSDENYSRTDRPERQARVVNVLARYAESCGQLEKAVELYRREAEIRNQRGIEGEVSARRSVVNIFERMIHDIVTYQRLNADAYRRMSVYRLEQARELRNMGELENATAVYERAITDREKAYGQSHSEGDKNFIRDTAHELVTMFAERGDRLAQFGLYDDALSIYRRGTEVSGRIFGGELFFPELVRVVTLTRDAMALRYGFPVVPVAPQVADITWVLEMASGINSIAVSERLGRVNEELGTSFLNAVDLVGYASRCGILATVDIGTMRRLPPESVIEAIIDGVVVHRSAMALGHNVGIAVAGGVKAMNRSLAGEKGGVEVLERANGNGESGREGRDLRDRRGKGADGALGKIGK